MQTKNWKTTLAGIGTAVVMVVVQLIIAKGAFNPVLDIAAIGIAILGYLAGDKNVEQTIKDNPTLTAILGTLDKLSSAFAEAQPSNIYVKEIHGFLSALDQNVQALPAAVAASIPAPVVNIDASTNNAAPAAEPAPAVPLYNPYSGKLLTEDPLPETK
jgi:hypothetical protein